MSGFFSGWAPQSTLGAHCGPAPGAGSRLARPAGRRSLRFVCPLSPLGAGNTTRGCVRAFSQYREAESPRCGERAAARKRRGRASGTQVRAEHSKEGAAGNFFVRPPTRHAPYRIPAVGGVATALPLPASYAQELRALNGQLDGPSQDGHPP